MFHKIGLFILGLAILSTIVTVYVIWKSSLPLVSPIALIETMIGSSPAIKSKKIIYGFFPYWNTKYSDQLYIQQLTHFAYFAIDLNPDGTINKKNIAKEQEPGWNKLNSKPVEKLLYQSKLLGQKTVLTVTAMDPELIESIAVDNIHSQTAVNSIMTVYRDFGFEDINVDFEYIGEPTQSARDGFTNFIKKLKIACKATNSRCSIDIDIFADTATKYRLWDLKALSGTVDRFVVMAYDYYRKSSSQAGPVAPLTGKCDTHQTDISPCIEMDIVSHISQITKVIPSEKIILGIPFYGYEWQTASKDFLANTYPRTGALATYQRIQSLYSDYTISALTTNWSSSTLCPYLSFEKDNEIHQIYFENAQSIEQKIKFVETANLGGIAIWALGYESPYLELWLPIRGLISL